MRYLRMLTNAVVGGLVVAGYLTVLVLHLNPALELHAKDVIPLFLTMALFYGVHAAALFYALIVVWRVLAVEVLSPGWLSIRLLAWILAGASALGAALMWTNLFGFEAALGPLGARRMTTAAIALTACAALLGAFAGLRSSFGRRDRRLSAVLLLTLATVASLVLPFVARRPAGDDQRSVRATSGTIGALTPEQVPRLSMLLLDGASLEFIAPVAAQGRLPHFGKLLDDGAVMHLATLRPTQPAPVWTSIATGKLPFRHGIRSAATYAFRGGERNISLLPDYCYAQALVRFGFLSEEPHTSAAILSTPFWEILGSFGISAGVVGWPLTFPANPLRGYLVSDEFARTTPSSRIALAGDPAIVYPDDLLPVVQRAYDAVTPALASSTLAGASVPSPPYEGENGGATNPILLDRASEHVAATLQNDQPAQVTAVRYPGLDAMGHQYLRYAMPRTFGNVSDEDRRRYGRVLEQYYSYLDAMIGRAAAALGPNDLLLIVSGFGMEPLSPGKQLLERFVGNPSLSGTHERAPDGFLIAYGAPVRQGRLNRGSVLDVVPTILYFLGLPVARDMDGQARTDVFLDAFTSERPITFIPSYD